MAWLCPSFKVTISVSASMRLCHGLVMSIFVTLHARLYLSTSTNLCHGLVMPITLQVSVSHHIHESVPWPGYARLCNLSNQFMSLHIHKSVCLPWLPCGLVVPICVSLQVWLCYSTSISQRHGLVMPVFVTFQVRLCPSTFHMIITMGCPFSTES